MIRLLSTFLALGLVAPVASAQDSKAGSKITFSVTRFDPLDRPSPKFVVKNGAKEVEVEVPLTYIAGPFTATESDVAIKLGTAKPILVQPAKSAILSPGAGSSAPTLPVVIKQKDGDEWKLVSTENWPNDARFRNFLFLYKSLRDHHMAIHCVSERVD